MELTREEIIKRIRENREKIEDFGIKKIGVFGSGLKAGVLEEDSDIDIVVEFERGKATFKNVCGLVDLLEGLFNREIDLLTPDGIESIRIRHVKEEIQREVEYV